MSDSGREDDLFGDSDNDGQAQVASRQPSPVASSSKSPAQAQAQDQAQSPVVDEDRAGDLFGDDDEEDERAKRGRTSTGTPASRRSGSRTRSRSRSRSGSANPLEYEEEDVGEEKIDERWATLPIPQWNKMKATDDKVWHMKLPAYVNVDSSPYEPDLYRENLNGEETIDGSINPIAAKSRMIGVRNTIRWKWVTGGDGEPMRQSNARMLRWSDGSVSLQLGSDLFDVAPSHGATLARPQDPKPPIPAGKSTEEIINTVSSTTFLAVTAPNETVLVTERSIAGQLSLLPTSMDSKTHLELVKHVGQQHVKHSRMKMLEETADEETLQKLLLKSAPNIDLIKSHKPISSTVRKSTAGNSNRLGRTSSGGVNKRKFNKKSYYSDTEDEEGSDVSNDKPRSSRRTANDSLAGLGAGGDYDEDDGFVVADSDEEDDYGKSSSKKRKNKNKKRKGKSYSDDEDDEDAVEEEETDLDEMERAERRIEEKERQRKKAKISTTGGSKKKSRDYVDTDEEEEEQAAPAAGGQDQDAEGEEDVDMDMDVESEED
ncbi:uncharacterized protein IL334_000804 [Kwoniella shivajii]|uniref:RNA polymerase-associated protein LEO1 n=1 Tax=Kwoniella shivajii TaxID=564305 RepID=A0ABZ1CQ72_9TREE|nr:hypothetical protein IL334_000804 [Kwoniella shivajii]